MLRHIVRKFSRTLSLKNSHPGHALSRNSDKEFFLLTKKFYTIPATFCTATPPQSNPFDTDDYIAPYKPETESKSPTVVSRQGLLDALRYKYRMRSEQLKIISTAELKFGKNQLRDVNRVVDILLEHGINKTSIVENPWVLTIGARLLETKLSIIHNLAKGDINEVVPFLKLSGPRLMKIVDIITKESDEIPGGNRLYYISEKLNLEPKIVSQYLSRRLFMIEMPFEMLSANLRNMVNFGVPPLAILKDLWAFRYTPKSVKSRLQRAQNAKKGKIMPWMVRCPEEILQRSLKLSLDERKLLGEHNTTVDYIAQRLGYDVETIHTIMSKHPPTLRIRAPKIKEILDYLLIEEKFEPYQIASVMRILCHSLKTTKERIEELKSCNCRPSSLVIICRSQNEFRKFVRTWTQSRNKDENNDT